MFVSDPDSETPPNQQQLLSAPYPRPSGLRPPTHEGVILYHLVWRAFLKKSADRPGLPPEIVAYIAIFAGWLLPEHKRTLKTSKGVRVECYGGEATKVSKRWFATEPLMDCDITGIVAFQLSTVAKDQGWTSLYPPASFSWFEVAIEREGELVPQLRWKSHHNALCGKEMSREEGAIIPAPGTEWKVGDVISVWLYAQSYAWSNEAEEGVLFFYKWFQPVIPLRLKQ